MTPRAALFVAGNVSLRRPMNPSVTAHSARMPPQM